MLEFKQNVSSGFFPRVEISENKFPVRSLKSLYYRVKISQQKFL